MANSPTEEDKLIAKLAAMEIMMLTLVRPLGGNPKFWADVDAIAEAFQRGNQDTVDAFPQRWKATLGFLSEWQKIWNPGN